MTRTVIALGLATMVPLLACGDPDRMEADAGGGGTDGGSGGDGGVGGTDGGAGDDVARCRAAAASLATTCEGDGDRTCHVGAYRDSCSADGRAGLFADGLDCLRAMSSAGSCRTFSDPSGAATCIDAVYAGITSEDIDAVLARVSTVCPAAATQAARTEPPLYALTPAQLSTLRSCIEAATDCETAGACTEAIATSILACYE